MFNMVDIQTAAKLQEWLAQYNLQPVTEFIKSNGLQAEADSIFRVARTMRCNVKKHYGEWYENGKKVEL